MGGGLRSVDAPEAAAAAKAAAAAAFGVLGGVGGCPEAAVGVPANKAADNIGRPGEAPADGLPVS